MAREVAITEFVVPDELVANKEGSIIKIQREMQSQYGDNVYLRFEFNPMRLVGIKVEDRE